MKRGRNPGRNYMVIGIALALAAIFIYAGAGKIFDPLRFADSIYAFSILPAVLINLLALGLPVFEMACGVMLIAPWTRRIGALAVALTCLLYFSVLLSALVRGLTLDCGCFGTGTPSRARMWVELGLDAVLFAGSLFVYFRVLENAAQLSDRGLSA
jgi:putative oxidoreductase